MQSSLIAVAVWLAVLATAVLILGIMRRNAVRAVFTAACLLAASGVTGWVAGGGEFALGRNYVVITARDIPRSSLRELLSAISAIPDRAHVAFVVLAASEPDSATGDPTQKGQAWRLAAEYSQDRQLLDGVLNNPANVVNVAGKNWAAELVERGIVLLRDAPGLLSRGTLLVLAVDTETWLRADVREISTGQLGRMLAREDQTELYQVRVKRPDPLGHLKLVPNRLVFPTAPTIADLAQSKIRVELHDCPPELDPSRLRLRVWMSGPAAASAATPADARRFELSTAAASRHRLERDEDAPRICHVTMPLSSLTAEASAASTVVVRGLYLVEASVETPPAAGGASGSTYRARTYLLVESSSILLLAPTGVSGGHGALGPLGQHSWEEWAHIAGEPAPSGLERLLDSFFSRQNWGQVTRAPKFGTNIVLLPMRRLGSLKEPIPDGEPADAGRTDGESGEEEVVQLREALDAVRTVFFVEPTALQLRYLDALLSLDSRIREGLNVVVVAPPRVSDNALPWLPAVPVPALGGSDRPLHVHAEERLYLLLDHSRSMRFKVPGTDATGLDLQFELTRELARELGLDEATIMRSDRGHITSGTGKLLASDALRRGAGAQVGMLRFYPPMVFDLSGRDSLLRGAGDFGAGSKLGYKLDVAPGSIKLRLNSLFIDPRTHFDSPHYRTLLDGDRFPNTHVVLVVSDLPQVDELYPMRFWIGDEEAVELALPEELVEIDNLLGLGLQVHPVVIPQQAWLPEYEQALSGAATDTAEMIRERSLPLGPSSDARRLPGHVAEPIEVSSLDDARSAARSLAERIREHRPGKITVQDHSRTFDIRVKPGSSPPSTHLILERRADSDSAADDTRLPMAAYADYPVSGGTTPVRFGLVEAQTYGEGQVTVLGYSPFEQKSWDEDAGPATWNGGLTETVLSNEARYLGMGVQRLIDAYGLAGAVRPFPPTRLVPSRVEVEPDGAGLQVEFWGRLDVLSTSKPVLERDDKRAIPLELFRLDLDDDRATFRLRATEPISGIFALKFGAEDRESLPIYVDLQPATGEGTTIWEAFRLVAQYTGGGEVSAERGEFPATYQQAVPWAAALAITLIVISIFSPLARPWTAFLAFLRRRSGQHALALTGRYRLDIDAFLAEWGAMLGRTRSGRIAGMPGGEKLYESGDSLESARPESLFPFVSGKLRLPQRPPVVRLTHITHSLNALVLVGNGVGLRVPDASRYVRKSDAAVFAAGVIASVVWQQGGMVRAGSLYSADMTFGPVSGGGNADTLARYLEALIAAPARVPSELALPADADDGSTVFVISDFLQTPIEQLVEFVARASARDMSCRFLKVFDPDECRMVGLGKTPGSWMMLDRSQVSVRDLEAAYAAHAEELRRALEDVDARMVMLDTSEDAAELARKFREGGFFE